MANDNLTSFDDTEKKVKRTGFLAKLATIPALFMGASLLSNVAPTAYEGEATLGSAPAMVEGETAEFVTVGEEGTSHLFAGMFNGRYMTSMFRRGFPTQDIIKWARDNGFDRYEVWNNGRVIFQDTTEAGKVPQGWQSLQFAGHIDVPGRLP